MAGRILVVDDERDMLLLLRRILGEQGHEVVAESDPEAAVARARAEPFDLVITDLKMPGLDGIGLLEQVREARPQVPVVIMTAYATIETAVEAVRKGAHDYLTKPFRRERVQLLVEKAMEWRRVVDENRELRSVLARREGAPELIGASAPVRAVLERVRQVAPTMATVLITGESGTGKEMLARLIHAHSDRADRRLVTLNCTAIPEQILESELFGHVKGAFTGAWRDKKGLVEEAAGGTLFLDEIGDLSPFLQTKLLRLLQEGEYRPVGGLQTRQADLRVVAATHHNLRDDIRAGAFREDLYYRLNVVHIELPPLRERRDDVALLARHFLQKHARRNGKPIASIAPAALQVLQAYDFPGNVRELENLVERGVIFCAGDTLGPGDLRLEDDAALPVQPAAELAALPFREARDRMLQLFHRQYIETLLGETGGNVSKAADRAGIQRQYLHRLMKEAGIEADGFRGSGE